MPQYQLAARAEANRLEAKADASSAKAITDVQPGAQLPRQAPAGVVEKRAVPRRSTIPSESACSTRSISAIRLAISRQAGPSIAAT